MIDCRLSVIDRFTGAGYAEVSFRSSACRAPSCTKSRGDTCGTTSASWELIRSGSRIATAPIGLASGFPRARRGAPAFAA